MTEEADRLEPYWMSTSTKARIEALLGFNIQYFSTRVANTAWNAYEVHGLIPRWVAACVKLNMHIGKDYSAEEKKALCTEAQLKEGGLDECILLK